MDDTVAVIQARMGSTRLPGKVLKDIGDEPMLWHVCERARHASLIDSILVATSTKSGDDPIESFCERRGIDCYRGSESDVLERYYEAASDVDASTVVRLTADCPFLSPAVIDRVLRTYHTSSVDYASNTLDYTYPDGLDVEVFGFDVLERAHDLASEPAEREHVTVYVRESTEFTTANVENVISRSRYSFLERGSPLRWTVDYPEDLSFVRTVYERLTETGHWTFGQEPVLELLAREPGLRRYNDDD